MFLTIDEFEHETDIPGHLAFGVIDDETRVRLSDNRNPGLRWGDTPEGTRSLVLFCVDDVVPSKPDDVNQPDREVPKDLPRGEFFHWVMVDIPTSIDAIEAGSCSSGITERGKQSPPGPDGSRQGINDYTGWFANDEAMGGEYFGYDGPCPPWNDSLVHRYHFVLFAIDLDRCPVDGAFTGADVRKAIKSHVLDQAQVTGFYTLNPRLVP